MGKYSLQTKMGELFDDRSFFTVFEKELPDVFHNQLIKMIGSPFLEQVRDYTLRDAAIAMTNIFHISKNDANRIKERILEIN